MKRTLTFLSDPSHGWLSVPTNDLVELGIADEISSYSYMSRTRTYLEEDRDATRYLEAAREARWDVTVSENMPTNGPSHIRSKARYDPYWAHNPLVEDATVGIHLSGNEPVPARVKTATSKRITVISPGGNQYHVPTSNPFNYVSPI